MYNIFQHYGICGAARKKRKHQQPNRRVDRSVRTRTSETRASFLTSSQLHSKNTSQLMLRYCIECFVTKPILLLFLPFVSKDFPFKYSSSRFIFKFLHRRLPLFPNDTINHRYMPTLGNGHIGATVYYPWLYLNGLFNGQGGRLQ